MKTYKKERLIFAVKDFFRNNKELLIGAFCLFILGFGIAVAVFEGADDYYCGCGRVIIWWLSTISIFYLLLYLTTFSKYLIFSLPLALLYLGYRLGIAAAFLIVAAGLKGFINLCLIYLPIAILTTLAGCFFISLTIPYFSSSPNCSKYPNCGASIKKILIKFLFVFAVNVAFAVLWILIFGIFINVIYVNPV